MQCAILQHAKPFNGECHLNDAGLILLHPNFSHYQIG